MHWWRTQAKPGEQIGVQASAAGAPVPGTSARAAIVAEMDVIWPSTIPSEKP
jgi:hypothetical protein